MFCENCGTDNIAGAKFCSACGAPLNSGYSEPKHYAQETYRQEPYQQETYQQEVYPQNQYEYYQPIQSYNQPRRIVNQRSTGAIVLYMIAGAIALLSILLPFLPQVSYYGQTANVPSILFSGYGTLVYISGSRSEYSMVVAMFIAAFAIPMVLQLVWAILSFARVRAAGVLGLIGSIISINVSIIWAAVLTSTTRRGVTTIPYMMIVLGIAGMVLSIIQLAKKNRVR